MKNRVGDDVSSDSADGYWPKDGTSWWNPIDFFRKLHGATRSDQCPLCLFSLASPVWLLRVILGCKLKGRDEATENIFLLSAIIFYVIFFFLDLAVLSTSNSVGCPVNVGVIFRKRKIINTWLRIFLIIINCIWLNKRNTVSVKYNLKRIRSQKWRFRSETDQINYTRCQTHGPHTT